MKRVILSAAAIAIALMWVFPVYWMVSSAFLPTAVLQSFVPTFIPVPGLAQAVFTIHVQAQPLTQAIQMAAQARPVCAALASMSQAVLDYRGLATARDRLLQWLGERAGNAGATATSFPAP